MKSLLTKIDWFLFVPVLLMNITGIITLISFNINNIKAVDNLLIIKHSISVGLGMIIAILIAYFDYRSLSKLVQPLFWGINILLILVLVFGNTINGAKSWFSLGFFNLQPAEFAKIIAVVIIAHYLNRYHYKINSFITIILSLIPITIIVFLILMQPDFGTAAVIILVWLGMVIFSGLKLQYIAVILSSLALIISSFWFWVFADYQKQRILTFLDPTKDPLGSGYNALQVMKSVSIGGVMGRDGFLIRVPEIHTDFIFGGFAQQWGFLGVSIYFILLILISSRIMYIGFKVQDNFAKMLVLGVILCLLTQALINIGMNVGLVPITGIPLPFLSYGGSSMLVSWLFIGIILSIKNNQVAKGTIFMKDTYDIFG